MKGGLLLLLIMSLSDMYAENNKRPQVAELNTIMREKQYWQNLFSALQEFKQNVTVSTTGYLKELPELASSIKTALINMALIQVLSHAMYVLKLRTETQFASDLRKTLINIQQDPDLKKELMRLARINLDPLWFLGKKTTVEQMAGVIGQDLVRAAALNQIVLKYAERVKKMLAQQVLELEEQKKKVTLKPLVDVRLGYFKLLENYVSVVIQECQQAYDAVVALAQQKINNQAFLQYVQNIGVSVRYVPDKEHVEYMEMIGNIAQALYPSAAYRKYMGQ